MLKRNLNTLTTIMLTAAFIAGCTGEASPTNPATAPVTRDVPAGASLSPDPAENGAAVPFATARPDNTEGAPIVTTSTVDVMSGYGGTVSDTLKRKVESGVYDVQQLGIRDWAAYWGALGIINSETPLQPEFIEDQNHMAVLALRVGNMYYFPPVVNGAPVYDGAPPPNTVLLPNYDVFRTSKTIDKNDPDFIKQGYDAVMSDLLDGSEFNYRGGQMVRLKNGAIVAHLDRLSSRWVEEENWVVCNSSIEAMSCRLEKENIYSGYFLDFAARHDNTGPFRDDVRNSGVIYEYGGDYQYGTHLTWPWPEQATIEGEYLTNADSRPNRRIGYGVFNNGDRDWGIKIVKYINPSGRVSFLQYTLDLDSNLVVDEAGMAVDFPIVEYISTYDSFNDSELIAAMREWAETGEIPTKLEVINRFKPMPAFVSSAPFYSSGTGK